MFSELNNTDSYLKELDDGRFSLNGKVLKCGAKICIYLEDKQLWISGRIRFNNAYCVYNDEVGDIVLRSDLCASVLGVLPPELEKAGSV